MTNENPITCTPLGCPAHLTADYNGICMCDASAITIGSTCSCHRFAADNGSGVC